MLLLPPELLLIALCLGTARSELNRVDGIVHLAIRPSELHAASLRRQRGAVAFVHAVPRARARRCPQYETGDFQSRLCIATSFALLGGHPGAENVPTAAPASETNVRPPHSCQGYQWHRAKPVRAEMRENESKHAIRHIFCSRSLLRRRPSTTTCSRRRVLSSL